MNDVSLCILTDNNRDCLNAIKSLENQYKELIVIETSGRNDFNNELLNLNAIIYYKKFNNDFSELRNFAIEKASKEWIFFIDSDETFQGYIPELSKEFTHYILPQINGVNTIWTARIFLRNDKIRFAGKLHETIEDTIEYDKGCNLPMSKLIHTGYDSIEKINSKLKRNLEIIKNDSGNPLYNYHLANIYYAIQEFNLSKINALKSLDAFIPDYRKADMCNLLYRISKQENNIESCIFYLEKSLEYFPLQIYARYELLNYVIENSRLQILKEIQMLYEKNLSKLSNDLIIDPERLNQEIKNLTIN